MAVNDAPVRRQAEARRIAAQHWPYRCCVICGDTFVAALQLAHLDQNAGNNDPDNLAWLCGKHHWMFDCALYPIEAVKMMRAHWQVTKGVPDHTGRLKDAGKKAGRTRTRQAAARKAVITRRQRQVAASAAMEPVATTVAAPSATSRSLAAIKAAETRRLRRRQSSDTDGPDGD